MKTRKKIFVGWMRPIKDVEKRLASDDLIIKLGLIKWFPSDKHVKFYPASLYERTNSHH
jgi:hypothetical protein